MRTYNVNDNDSNNNGSNKMRNLCIVLGVILITTIALVLILSSGSDKENFGDSDTEIEYVTFREMVNKRINDDGSITFYEIEDVPVWEIATLCNLDTTLTASELSAWISKDMHVNVYKYDGNIMKTVGKKVLLSDIAKGNFVETNYGENWHASWGAITDGSGNLVVDEFIYDQRNTEELNLRNTTVNDLKDTSLFTSDFGEKNSYGSTFDFGYHARFDIYDKAYILFFSDSSLHRRGESSIIFIDDKNDTQNKEFSFDSTGVDGINYD